MGTIKTTNIEPIADNGTVTLGSSGDQFTLATGAKSSFLYPAFEAKLSGNQTFSDNTDTIIQFNTERFDTNGMFNTSTYTWTPTVAGKYFVYCTALVKSDDIQQMTRMILNIVQNGSTNYTESEFRPQPYQGSTYTPTINAVMDFNGSTDNIKMQIFADVTSSSPSVQASGSLFGAYRIGS